MAGERNRTFIPLSFHCVECFFLHLIFVVGNVNKATLLAERSSCKKYCAVPEHIPTHPKEGHWKFQGGGGSQKPKFLKESMKLKWNF